MPLSANDALEMLADLRERMAGIETTTRHMSSTLDSVLAEARRTNGRITKIETDRASEAAAAAALIEEAASDRGWRAMYVAPVVTGTLVGVSVAALKLLGIS